MQQRLVGMMDEFEGERQSLILDTQATAKVLNERLDKEREAMNSFKVTSNHLSFIIEFINVFYLT